MNQWRIGSAVALLIWMEAVVLLRLVGVVVSVLAVWFATVDRTEDFLYSQQGCCKDIVTEFRVLAFPVVQEFHPIHHYSDGCSGDRERLKLVKYYG